MHFQHHLLSSDLEFYDDSRNEFSYIALATICLKALWIVYLWVAA